MPSCFPMAVTVCVLKVTRNRPRGWSCTRYMLLLCTPKSKFHPWPGDMKQDLTPGSAKQLLSQ